MVRTYLKHTPITKRNVDDLTALLLSNDLNLADIKSLPKSAEGTAKLIADAKFFAEEIKRQHDFACNRCEINSRENQNIFNRYLGHKAFD